MITKESTLKETWGAGSLAFYVGAFPLLTCIHTITLIFAKDLYPVCLYHKVLSSARAWTIPPSFVTETPASGLVAVTQQKEVPLTVCLPSDMLITLFKPCHIYR